MENLDRECPVVGLGAISLPVWEYESFRNIANHDFQADRLEGLELPFHLDETDIDLHVVGDSSGVACDVEPFGCDWLLRGPGDGQDSGAECIEKDNEHEPAIVMSSYHVFPPVKEWFSVYPRL